MGFQFFEKISDKGIKFINDYRFTDLFVTVVKNSKSIDLESDIVNNAKRYLRQMDYVFDTHLNKIVKVARKNKKNPIVGGITMQSF